MTALYHGGKPGLRPGDLIIPAEPHFIDNCPICEAKKTGISTAIDPLRAREDRVYVTSDREYARFYASKYPRGSLYSVEPVGELELSTEDHFPTWTVPTARVRSVYDRCVQLTAGQRRRLLRRWYVADMAAEASA